MSSFAADISAFAKKTNKTVDAAVREVVMELAREIDRRSPVGNTELWVSLQPYVSLVTPTGKYKKNPAGGKVQYMRAPPKGYIGGHFRANNQYRFGSVPSNEIDGVDKSGSKTVEAIRAGVYSSPVAGVHYIANNVPYAMRLENGWSTQAPAPLGIYKLAMMTVTGKLNSIVQRVVK